MDLSTDNVVKSVVDIVDDSKTLSKATDALGMLFPFAGIKRKAVEVYIDEIQKSNLPADTKAYMILDTRKTFRKLKNQGKIADIAIKNAKQDTDFTNKSGVNEEWLERFMDSAGFVSEEEIQITWGKILANEFERPGSTPPNMIRVLSEITPELARAFRLICSMTVMIAPLIEDGCIESYIRDIFVPYKKNIEKLGDMGLSFHVLNELDTLGVIKIETIGSYVLKSISNQKVLLCVEDHQELVEKYNADGFPIGNVMLTSVGRALQSITEPIEIDGYQDMVKAYLEGEGVAFAAKQDYVVKSDGDTLKIYTNDVNNN